MIWGGGSSDMGGGGDMVVVWVVSIEWMPTTIGKIVTSTSGNHQHEQSWQPLRSSKQDHRPLSEVWS